MKWLSAAVLCLVVTPWCLAQQAKVVPPEVLDRIVDDNPNPLPRYMTPAERLLPLRIPTSQDREAAAPPTGVVHTPAEYDRNEGMLISWGSYNDVLTAMTVGITTGDPEAIVYILVSGASQQASATSTLTSAGADLDQVEFITYTTNTVWIRDYGPRFIFEDGPRAIVDHVYNRPRPLDDAFPPYLGTLWGEPVYDLPLVHGGGNFHLFSNGDAFMSELILTENSGLSEQDVKDYYADYLNVDLTIYDGFPTSVDSTRHIDMWMMPLDDDKIIIGEYPGSASYPPKQITDSVAADLTARGYTVYRTPGWNSGSGGYNGTHYTYTNSVILNDLVFIPQYGGSYASQDAQAKAVFETALPDHQVIQVDCSSIIHAAGAMHCIVMHVPAYANPIPSIKILAPDGGELWTIGQDYEITWTAYDDVAVTSVDIYYSTDSGGSFPHPIAIGETDDGSFLWTVPNTPSTQCRVKVIAHDDDSNSAEDVSASDFEITAYGPQLIYSFPLDTDPAWTEEGEWNFGKPTGGGGDQGGPDPVTGHTGNNVYGYDLQGDYNPSIPEYHLTSEAIDCTGFENVAVKFWRWLGVEQPTYDHARFRVSSNGTDWTTIWENSVTVSDTSWVAQQFDVSEVADGQAALYLRWSMGPTDSDWEYCGWNIDDIEVWAIPANIDCNDNSVPDYLDILDGTSEDCNENGVPDECDVDGGGSADSNANGVPDECEIQPPAAPAPPHNTPKNRYISFAPNNAGVAVAFSVELTGSSYFPGSVGPLGWVGEADENGIARLSASPVYGTAWPTVIHLGDCAVVPVATFAISATPDGSSFSNPLVVGTIARPSPQYWADCVGQMAGGAWTVPNGVVNFDDVTAAVQYFTSTPTAPHLTTVDLEPQEPNAVLNFADIQQIVYAFQGDPYPFGSPVSAK
ncbi:MAG: agmatine deiminase family protein [Planctomycetes bacterium]|nr:agmatine deiminase family protein [Planctomycetota bacterium]